MSENETDRLEGKKEENEESESGNSVIILLLSNIPCDCDSDYLRLWIEARGFRVSKLNLIEDKVSETSPGFAHVQLMHAGKAEEAARTLNGQLLKGRTIQARVLIPQKWQATATRAFKIAV